eukprot:TRINITY_DN67314_c5_g18_i1.p1 TRINITY_DN67314_c5_g18~~TRINITY_DN67314_c5_g18_i1.p1  ORF type:complete len:678 (+),score=57.73 TRINITY_DN67314_c5_g18_i1:86-2119(+)
MAGAKMSNNLLDADNLDILQIESRCNAILRRMDKKAEEAKAKVPAADLKAVKVIRDWKDAETNYLEEWKAMESLGLKEWRERESLGVEEWKEREQIYCMELRFRNDVYELLRIDRRTVTEMKLDKMTKQYDDLYYKLHQQTDILLHSLRPDANTTSLAQIASNNRVGKKIRLWNEIRRLETVAKQQQVRELLGKGSLIQEIEDRQKREDEEKEWADWMAATEREKKAQRKKEEIERLRAEKEFSEQMLTYLRHDHKYNTLHLMSKKERDDPVLTSSSYHTSGTVAKLWLTENRTDKARVGLGVRVALLRAFRYLTAVELCSTIVFVCREWRQMTMDDRLLRAQRDDVVAHLQLLGMRFCKIPAGTYCVGKPRGIDPSEVSYKAQNGFAAEFFTSEKDYTLNTDLYVSEDVITVTMWLKMIKRYPHLKKFVRYEDINLCGYNIINSGSAGRQAEVISKDICEEDPALELPFASAAKVTAALFGTIPTWEQWEAAVRGPNAYLYPWGNTFDPITIEIEGQVHGYNIPNPHYNQLKAKGQPDVAHEMVTSTILHRMIDFGQYQVPSPFGLKGLLRWGKEWNVAQYNCVSYEPTDEISTHCVRSCADLWSKNDCNCWDAPIAPDLMMSNHRTFSAPMAFCLRAPKYFGDKDIAPRASFRLAFHLDGSPQILAARPLPLAWF